MSKKIFSGLVIQFACFILYCNVYGQTRTTTHVEYTYDETGNRTGRHVISLKQYTDTTFNKTDSLTEVSNDSIQQQSSATTSGLSDNDLLFTEQFGEIELSVFPNPTNGKLTLKTNLNKQVEDSKIILYNETGILLFQKENIKPQQIVDLTAYSTGIYYLKVKIKNVEKTFKIIKSK